MRQLLVCCFALALFACGSSDDDSGGGPGGGGCDSAGQSPAAFECKILELVNQERAAGATCGGKAMPPVGSLSMHPVLRQTARAHATDMAQNGFFSHDNLQGKSPFDRMTEAGYDYASAGENIAAGSPSPEAAMEQWMQSPGHCGNVMKASFTDLGVGYAYADASQYGHYWVQNFGSQ